MKDKNTHLKILFFKKILFFINIKLIKKMKNVELYKIYYFKKLLF